jgi:ssDNA-binding Zn-finger/Zn-ribbon topoisomerase 1
MSEELLRCPFCGADAEMQHDKRMGYRVCCSNWKTCSGCIMVFEYNELDAIAAWNQRAEHMDRCKFFIQTPVDGYSTCKNMNWHHNGTYRCSCNGDKSCKFYAEPLGNSDELQPWVIRAIMKKRSDYSPYIHDELVFREALEWVLSLKRGQ